MPCFHNTTRERGQMLLNFQAVAKRQEQAVLNFFIINMGDWTPSEIFLALPELNCPITSIRRAICNLTESNKLRKTEIKRIGMYKRPEYAWCLNDQ